MHALLTCRTAALAALASALLLPWSAQPVAGGALPATSLTPDEIPQPTIPAEQRADWPGHKEEQHDPPHKPTAESRQRETAPPAVVKRGTFHSVQVNVNDKRNNVLGDAANEPSITVDPTDRNRMAVGWRQFDDVASNFRQAGNAFSTDGGQNWTFPGVLTPGTFRSDPVLDFNSEGVFYYYSLMGDFTVQMFRSFDGGANWGTPIPAFGGDKAWIAVDRTDGIGKGNIYAVWSNAAACCGDDIFTRSTDGGLTFMTPIPVPNFPRWGTMAVGPDGQLYIAGRTQIEGARFVRSLDALNPQVTPSFDLSMLIELGGQTAFGRGPNPGGLLGQVWVAADHSQGPTRGNIYMLGSVDPPGTDPLDVMFIRSTDGGLTWSEPVRVNDDPPLAGSYQWFGTMSVAPHGRIDVIWNDMRADPDGDFSELYYSSSADAGESWLSNIPLSPPFNHTLGYPNQEKLGDYYDMISDETGADLVYAATFNGEQDVYYLRISAQDCNTNNVADSQDIATGTSQDCNANSAPDECESVTAGDFDADGDVDLDDYDRLAECLAGPNTAPAPVTAECIPACLGAFDVDGDNDVDLDDVADFQFAFNQ